MSVSSFARQEKNCRGQCSYERGGNNELTLMLTSSFERRMDGMMDDLRSLVMTTLGHKWRTRRRRRTKVMLAVWLVRNRKRLFFKGL